MFQDQFFHLPVTLDGRMHGVGFPVFVNQAVFLAQAVDYLGSPLAIEQGDTRISEGCIYITGPGQLHLSR